MAIASTQTATVVSPVSRVRSYGQTLVVITMLFLMWGFLTSLNDVLVLHLKSVFDLNRTRVMLVQLAFFSTYLVFAIPASKLVARHGYQRTMAGGLLTMSLGAFLFIPAASIPSYLLFLGALAVLGAGITVLQVAANPYVSLLGNPQTAASRLTLTQAFNSLGTAIAPKLGGILILSAAPLTAIEMRTLSPGAIHYYRVAQAASVKLPYILVGIALMVLAVAMASLHLPEIAAPLHASAAVSRISLWRHRTLLLGTVAVFTYVGAEVAIGSFLMNYFSHSEIGGLSARAAAGFVSLYWLAAMVGRFVGAAVLQKVRTRTLLAFCAGCAAVLALTSMLSTGHVAMWSIIAVGFFNSVMFPSIFTLGIAGLGALTGRGSGILIMGIVGGAVVPFLQGFVTESLGIHRAFALPVICYLYVLFFAIAGSRTTIRRVG